MFCGGNDFKFIFGFVFRSVFEIISRDVMLIIKYLSIKLKYFFWFEDINFKLIKFDCSWSNGNKRCYLGENGEREEKIFKIEVFLKDMEIGFKKNW